MIFSPSAMSRASNTARSSPSEGASIALISSALLDEPLGHGMGRGLVLSISPAAECIEKQWPQKATAAQLRGCRVGDTSERVSRHILRGAHARQTSLGATLPRN